MGFLAGILAKLVGSVGLNFFDRFLAHLERNAQSETERLRIQTVRQQADDNNRAGVIQTAMQYKVFWIPWLIATVPLSAWFGWGMLDTAFNGALPDVAEIPPGLLPWAQSAWASLFYSGGGVASVQIVSDAVARALARRK